MNCAFDEVAYDNVAFDVCETDIGGGLGFGLGYARRVPEAVDMDDDALVMLLITEILLNE